MSMIWQSLNQDSYKRTSNKSEAQYPLLFTPISCPYEIRVSARCITLEELNEAAALSLRPLINDNY